MERFYLKRTANHISITDRVTHELLGFTSLDDKKKAKSTILEIANMSTKSYIKYALGLGLKFKEEKTGEFTTNKDLEEWYEGAWKTTTSFALKEIGLTEADIPFETITPSLVKEVRLEIKNLGKETPISSKKALPKKEIKEVIVEEKKEGKKPLKKQLVSKKEEEETKKDTRTPLEILKEEFEKGDISVREFIKRKKELNKGV